MAGSSLVAETDADAVEFYRRCGFAVERIGEQYVGVDRFRCTLVQEGPEREVMEEPRVPGFIGGGASSPAHDVRADEAPYEPRSWRD